MIPRAKLIIYKQRVKDSGKYPVKLRIIHNRQHKDYSIGVDLTEEEFEQACKSVPPKHLRNEATVMQNVEVKARLILSKLAVFTFQKFETEFNGQTKDAADIFPFFDDYIQDLKAEGRIKTAISYQTAANAFKKFVGNKKLHLLDITSSFLKKFQEFQVGEGKSITTVGIYIRTLRAIYNHCIAKGVIKKDTDYPFGRGKYIIPTGKNIKKALQIDEIKKIYEFPLESGSYAERARDMWIFSFFCNGINFKDLAFLKYKNIDGDMIRFVREKTKRTSQSDQKIISCHLSPKAKEILERWQTGDNSDKEAFVFPILEKSDSLERIEAKVAQFIKNTNNNMKVICGQLGIEQNVTTYSSRHSAATIMKNSGASIYSIQEAMGHSTPIVTQKYLAGLSDESKKDLAKVLTDFL